MDTRPSDFTLATGLVVGSKERADIIAAARTALDALAKHFGLLKERIEVDTPTTIRIVHQQLSSPNDRPGPRGVRSHLAVASPALLEPARSGDRVG